MNNCDRGQALSLIVPVCLEGSWGFGLKVQGSRFRFEFRVRGSY